VVSARQAAYLQALGVDVYVPRGVPLAIPQGDAPLAVPRDAPLPPQGSAVAGVPIVATPGPAVRDVPSEFGQLGWEELRAAVAACERCELHRTRTQTVFGVGNREARWMFIGEAPGVEEDRQGEPFVGRAGQLLNSMLRAVGLKREDVFIANVLKCRPPNNRDPKPEEATQCRGYLERQVALVNPTLIVAVGRIAAQQLLATETPIARLRGKVHSFGARGWPLVVMYHPAYLLRSPSEKRKAWADLVQARQVQERFQRDAEAARA
jgi:DNA polymerase